VDPEGKVADPQRTDTSSSKVSDSPLPEEILGCEFPKLSTLTFDYYSGASDPVQHIRHFRDKIIVHSRNDALIGVKLALENVYFEISIKVCVFGFLNTSL